MRLGSTRRPNSTAFNTSAAGLVRTIDVGLSLDVGVLPAVAEPVEQDQELRQAQLGLVHHSVLRCWDLLSWAAGALEVFKLCCRVGKEVNLGQVVFALRALNVLW